MQDMKMSGLVSENTEFRYKISMQDMKMSKQQNNINDLQEQVSQLRDSINAITKGAVTNDKGTSRVEL